MHGIDAVNGIETTVTESGTNNFVTGSNSAGFGTFNSTNKDNTVVMGNFNAGGSDTSLIVGQQNTLNVLSVQQTALNGFKFAESGNFLSYVGVGASLFLYTSNNAAPMEVVVTASDYDTTLTGFTTVTLDTDVPTQGMNAIEEPSGTKSSSVLFVRP